MIASACKKNSTDTNAVNKPVVEAYLVAGQPLSVKVYQQKDLTDTATYGVALTGLSINVSNGTQTVKLTEGANGTYTYSDAAFITANKTYSMQFTYNNTSVSASTVMPGKPVGFKLTDSVFHEPNTLDQAYNDKVLETITWTNPDSLQHMLLFKNTDSNPFEIIAVRNNRNASFEINTERASTYSITQTTFKYYGFYKVILLRVNDEYINVLTSNTRGTSQNLVNTPTNVVNGLGIFTAMQADTLNLRVTTE
jgi:plastocyanin